jgi:hypothetical protein
VKLWEFPICTWLCSKVLIKCQEPPNPPKPSGDKHIDHTTKAAPYQRKPGVFHHRNDEITGFEERLKFK